MNLAPIFRAAGCEYQPVVFTRASWDELFPDNRVVSSLGTVALAPEALDLPEGHLLGLVKATLAEPMAVFLRADAQVFWRPVLVKGDVAAFATVEVIGESAKLDLRSEFPALPDTESVLIAELDPEHTDDPERAPVSSALQAEYARLASIAPAALTAAIVSHTVSIGHPHVVAVRPLYGGSDGLGPRVRQSAAGVEKLGEIDLAGLVADAGQPVGLLGDSFPLKGGRKSGFSCGDPGCPRTYGGSGVQTCSVEPCLGRVHVGPSRTDIALVPVKERKRR